MVDGVLVEGFVGGEDLFGGGLNLCASVLLREIRFVFNTLSDR